MYNYDILPDHMQDGMRSYVEDGCPVGSFLYNILINDLAHSFAYADMINLQYMQKWAEFLLYELPMMAWGSPEKYDEWVKSGGLTRGHKNG